MDSATLVSLMKMGAKVAKLLEVKDKLTSHVMAGLTGKPTRPAIAGKPSEWIRADSLDSRPADDASNNTIVKKRN